MEKPIIALLTDFGNDSIYVGIMKAVISKICPQASIIDLTHSIEPQNIKHASFLLANSVDYFPEGTIFCCVVDPEVGSERRAIAVQTQKYTFISPDNGILTYYLKNNSLILAININNNKYLLENRSGTFDGRDVFAPVSAHLANGEDIYSIGEELSAKELIKLPDLICYEKEKGEIEGEIVFCDSFGNFVTAIHNSHLKSIDYKVQIENVVIEKISNTYADVTDNSFVAYFGSMGYLEIGIRNGNASNYFGKIPKRVVAKRKHKK